MHTRLEAHTLAGEALQAASGLQPLLQHAYLEAVLLEDVAAAQAAQTRSYDDYLRHSVPLSLKFLCACV